jgi:hypothetical protein
MNYSELKPLKSNPNVFCPRAKLDQVGIQSIVEIGSIGELPAIRKVSGFGLDHETLSTFKFSMVKYRNLLHDQSINVPLNYDLAVVGDTIVCIDELIEGTSLEKKIRSNEYKREWKTLVKTICKVRGEGTESKIMIDAKPANWISGRGRLYFVDMFPPPLRGSDGLVSPWSGLIYKRSKLLFAFNYGDIRGQLTKLLAGARIDFPSQFNDLKEIALDTIKNALPADIYSYVRSQSENGFPDMNGFYRDPVNSELKLRSLLFRV